MFGNEDSEEEDSEEETGGRSFFSETLGLGRPESPDPTKHLKAQLDEYEKDLESEKSTSVKDADGDSAMLEPSSEKAPTTTKLPNGDATETQEAHQTPVIEIPEIKA
jgi:protein phosphatase 2C family protein 2/3